MEKDRVVFISDDLFKWFEAEAKIQGRSVDSQVQVVLERHRARLANGVPLIDRERVMLGAAA